MEIRVGSIVRLKSGSPDMVVDEIHTDEGSASKADLIWYAEDGDIRISRVSLTSLLLVSDDDEKQNLTGAARKTISLCVGYRPTPDDGRFCNGKECFHCMIQLLVRGSL